MIPVSASVIWGELPSFWAKYNCCIEWGVHFVNVFNFYCILYLAGTKKSGNYTACVPCTVLITNGKRISMNWADCAFTLYLQNSIGTIKLLPHCHTLASFPGLPHFYLSFAFTIIHRSGLPIVCIIVNANRSQNDGGLGMRVVTLYIQPFIFVLCCFPILSFLFMDTCHLTKNVLWLCKSKF